MVQYLSLQEDGARPTARMHEPVHGGLSNDRIETKIARSWSRWRVSHRPGAALTKAKGRRCRKGPWKNIALSNRRADAFCSQRRRRSVAVGLRIPDPVCNCCIGGWACRICRVRRRPQGIGKPSRSRPGLVTAGGARRSRPATHLTRRREDEAGGATPGFSAQQWIGYLIACLGSDPLASRFVLIQGQADRLNRTADKKL